MGIDHFSCTPYNFSGIQDGYGSLQEEVVFPGKHSFSQFSGMELLAGFNLLPTTEHGKEAHLFTDQIQQQQQQQQQQQHQQELRLHNLMLEEFNFDSVLHPTQPFQETAWLRDQGVASSQHIEFNKQVPPSSLASLELQSYYGSKFKRLRRQNRSNTEASACRQKLSTEETIRLAGARYIQDFSQWYENFGIPMHPYGFGLAGLSQEENRDVELAQFLLAAADRVGYQQFERASRLLLHCQWNSSAIGNAVQRVVFHFALALREKINKETGKLTLKGPEKIEKIQLIQRLDTNASLICHKKIPFNQVMQFAMIQTIAEHLVSQRKIHLIDLEIGCGVRWTALMQALAERRERPVELLKISAIRLACKTNLEETRRRLTSFAASLNLPFLYKSVVVTDMTEIREDQFGIEDDEAVAIYSPYLLRTMVAKPDCLENLMRVIRSIKPTIMIVLEVEASHNSPSFVNRFIEALFFFSAFFDCLETCMKQENECRMVVEGILSEEIRNIVAMDDRERTVRNVKIDVWRRFFARYRMLETEFSESSLYHAKLVAKEFAHGNFCTLDKNGKCLTVGWKGTPIHSISAWKFI